MSVEGRSKESVADAFNTHEPTVSFNWPAPVPTPGELEITRSELKRIVFL